jgi:HEPN domain-containing protein
MDIAVHNQIVNFIWGIADDCLRDVYVRNITAVFSKFADKLLEPLGDDTRGLFDRLSLYYLEARYPEYKNNLSDMTDEETASLLLQKTKEVFQWLLTLKP